MHSHQVTLLGREFRIKSEEGPEHIDAVANYVNSKIGEMSAAKRHVPTQTVLLLATLNMADELFKGRQRLQAITERLRKQSRALLEQLGG